MATPREINAALLDFNAGSGLKEFTKYAKKHAKSKAVAKKKSGFGEGQFIGHSKEGAKYAKEHWEKFHHD